MMQDLQMPQFQPALNAVRQAAGWWSGELMDLTPKALRDALFQTEPDVLIKIGSEAVVIAAREDGAPAEEVLLEADLPDGEGTLFSGLPATMIERLENARRVAVEVDRNLALKKRIWLPLAAERNLKGAVHYQIERQFPFRLEHVDIAYRVIERDPEGGQLAVDVYVVERALLAPWLDRLMEVTGARLSVAVDDDATGDSVPLPLRGVRTRRPLGQSERTIRALSVLTALLVVLGAFQFYDMRERRAEFLQSAIDDLGPKIQAATAARGRVQRQLDALTVLRQASAKPRTAELLEALSLRLPDGGWLATFSVSGNAGSAQGFADNASNLPGLIDASPLFEATQLRAAVQRIADEGVERFELSFAVGGGEG